MTTGSLTEYRRSACAYQRADVSDSGLAQAVEIVAPFGEAHDARLSVLRGALHDQLGEDRIVVVDQAKVGKRIAGLVGRAGAGYHGWCVLK